MSERRRGAVRRWGRRVAIGVAALAGLVLLLVVGALVFLQTGAGGRLVREQVLSRVNAQLSGTLEIGEVDFRGAGLHLKDVVLRDPDGEVVATIAEVDLKLGLAALLRQRVHIELLRFARPEVHIVQREEGTNLQAALEPKEPKPEEPPKEGGGELPVDVVLDELAVLDGKVTYEQVGPQPRSARVEDLDLQASMSLLDGGDDLDGRLEAKAQLLEPHPGPVALSATAEGRDGKRSGRVDFSAAGAELVAEATLEGENLAAELKKLVVPPELVRAFSPDYPLVSTVRGTGAVTRAGSKVEGELHLSPGSGRIDAKGDFDLDAFRSDGVTVEVKDVDLSKLVADGPRSDLQLTLRAKGGGRSLETLEGSLRVEAPPSSIGDATFGPVDVAADAKDGRIALDRLDARLPGAALTARGEASRERVDLRGRLEATNLAALGETLGALAGPEGLPIRGSGALEFSLGGSLEAPSVEASGRFPLLAYAENRVRGLKLNATVPDVREPLAGNARVELRADTASLGERRFDCPVLELKNAGGEVAVVARTLGFVKAFLSLEGTADEDGRGLAVRSMTLRYPEARWTLDGPARVRFEEGRLAVTDLALESGRQRVAVDVDKSERSLIAHLQLGALDLSLLPKAVVDPTLGLQGIVSADVRVEGSAERPDVTARLSLDRGRFREYRDLRAAIDATWKDERARGSLDASGSGVRARGTFDVPLLALKTGASSPLRADLTVEDFSLDALAKSLERDLPARGVAGGSIRLRGTARDPRLRVELHGRELVVKERAPIDVDAVVRTDERGRLVARIDAKSMEKPGFVMLETPWTLGRLIRRAPTAEQAMRAPIAVTAKFKDFPLPLELGQPTLDLDADLRGSALALAGNAELTVKKLQSGDFPPVDASARLATDPRSMRLHARVIEGEKEILRAEADVGAALGRLLDPKQLEQVPLALEAAWGPLGVMELQALAKPEPPLPGERPPPILTGLTRGTLSARGTLEDPTVRFEATVHGLGSAQSGALGDVSLRYGYEGATHRLEADLLSGASGRMALRGTVPLDISWSKLREGIAWHRAKVNATLMAEGFDPQFLSGVHPRLLRVDGQVDAKVEVGGTVAVPDVDGRLEWKDGAAAIAGSGEYREIHLLVSGSEERVRIEELSASAGEGKARLTGEAVREGDERLRLSLDARLDEFPIVAEDQLAATMSLEAKAKGTASAELVQLNVSIPDARVELPSNAKKDLQKLDEPEDVVFLRNGTPVRGEEEAGEGQVAVGGSGAAGGGGAADREIRVVIDAPRNLWVSGDDLNVEVGLSEGFRVIMTDQPAIFGEVKVIRGRLEVFGRRFDLERDSSVAFGGPVMAPELNVTAVHENEREGVTVNLRVQGTAEDIQLRPTSDPPLPETEIYTLLATGRRSLRPGTGSAGGGGGNPAASVLGGLAAAQLKKGIEAALPLDVLSIEAGERGIAGTRVEAGTYVTDRLYLGVETQLGAQRDRDENANQLNVEYQLWKRWMLELEYGDARQGNADLIWRKQY